MIDIIPDLPPNVAAFRATGTVTKHDYETILIPHVDFVHKTYGKINFLLWLDTDVSHFTVGAWIDDVLVGIKHIAHWNKIAIVTHQDMVKKITDVLGHLIPGETKGFSNADLATALSWVSTH